MRPKARQSRILEVVASAGEARVEDLAVEFDVSPETIRRDLSQLAASGALQKVHGGARRHPLHAEGSYAERMAQRTEAKEIIARKLIGEIREGETLFVDTGTTTLACAAQLAGYSRLTVVTNSVHVADVLGRGPGIRLYLLGGHYRAENAQSAGPLVIEQVARFRADRAVVTVAALDAEAGATDADFDEAQIARAMIANARQAVVLADGSKLGKRAGFAVCPLLDVDLLVTDVTPGDGFAAALRAADVRVL